jgi:membrane fusion protein, copper/silver efflux system
MKPRIILLVLLVAAVAAAGGWLAAQKWGGPAASLVTAASGRKILYYQSAMHPWIKADQPGRCTICGMELSPVYEGDKSFDSGEGVIMLGSNAIQVINVQTDTVKRQPLKRSLRFAGTIDDDDTRHRIVSTYVDGRIDKLSVNYVGAEVIAGEPLATLYSPMLLTAEREYIALRKQREATSQGGDPTSQHNLSSTAMQRLKRFGLTDAQIAALPTKEPNDIHTQILAPMSGTVVARNVYEGQYVKEGEKLFEIADFSKMWLLFDAYERDLAWLKPGQKVIATTPSAPGKSFTGAIVFIDPNLREMTRSAKVRVELPNPLVENEGRKSRELFHKLFAEAEVMVELPEVLTVPRSAVLSPGARPLVYVDKGGGAYEQRKVRLGRVGEEDYEVLDGLKEGESVVTQGSMLIDAQAQLNSTATPAEASTLIESNFPPLTLAQSEAAGQYLALADALGSALAADDLKEFNAQAARTHSATPELLKSFAADGPWRALVTPLDSVGHLAEANDLKAARKSFHALSKVSVALAQALRRGEMSFRGVKVFRCPMTKDAFPDAPRTAEWIQLKPEVRNPWFGAEMLDCGSEVKP